MLGYLQMLVAREVFKEVQLSFLSVRHTHEDIEQVFSRTSQRLRKHNAITVEEMADELQYSYTPRPMVFRMKEVPSFSGLCEQEKALHPLTKAWSHLRYFRFTVAEAEARGSLMPTVCHAKLNCKGGWLPFNGG